MRKILGLVVAVSLMSGCSVALQREPSTRVATTNECSTTSAYWIADTTGAVAGATVAAVWASKGLDSDMNLFIAAAGASYALIYALSASDGHKWANQCRASQEAAPIASR